MATPPAPPRPVVQAWNPFAPWANPVPTPALQNPFAAMGAMWQMFPQGSMAAWPMACAMISAGVPQTVAWPTAEANLAAMDAAGAATQSMQKAFSNYRSSGGHASTQVVVGDPANRLMGLALAPLTAMFSLANPAFLGIAAA